VNLGALVGASDGEQCQRPGRYQYDDAFFHVILLALFDDAPE
jgi:hypothetical protein